MTTAAEFVATVLTPDTAWCEALPGWNAPFSDAARVLLTAISGQEAAWSARRQIHGPARGLWQFEEGGGVAGVLKHPASAALAAAACRAASALPTPASAWNALATHDGLALAFARLLLWTDPSPLPAVGQVDDAWDYYESNWRPGAPGPARWPANYAAAVAACVTALSGVAVGEPVAAATLPGASENKEKPAA